MPAHGFPGNQDSTRLPSNWVMMKCLDLPSLLMSLRNLTHQRSNAMDPDSSTPMSNRRLHSQSKPKMLDLETSVLLLRDPMRPRLTVKTMAMAPALSTTFHTNLEITISALNLMMFTYLALPSTLRPPSLLMQAR